MIPVQIVRRYSAALAVIVLLSLCLFVLLPGSLTAQTVYPASVSTVLQKAGANRKELDNTIRYFVKKGDSLQVKAAYFLIANMDIHYSYNYYWADGNGRRVVYNELDYPDFDSSLRAFEAIKKVTPKIHPVSYVYRDIDSIKSGFLIDNIESAFALWKQPRAKDLSFAEFCDYLLPYRVSIEPLENWRPCYQSFLKSLKDSLKESSINETINYWTKDCGHWFTNTFAREERKEPLPRLSALQLLHRKKGPCEDFTDLGVFEARTLGIAATVAYIPAWATSSDAHFFDVAFAGGGKNIPFEQLSGEPAEAFRLGREPGKVVRFTYSRQPGVIATLTAKENIPPNFLRTVNYQDVTSQYWETQDVAAPLFPSISGKQTHGISPVATRSSVSRSYVYACVFNTLDWKPIWWGSVSNRTALFTNMSKGVVYLPTYYQKGKLLPAGYPVAVGYHHILVLRPDTLHTHTIHLPEQSGYLQYRSGKKYQLYYWDNRWKVSGSQTAADNTTELVFTRVPQNALLLLVPEYTERKERPFMITNEGERVWW
jgi:hypothetical protein